MEEGEDNEGGVSRSYDDSMSTMTSHHPSANTDSEHNTDSEPAMRDFEHISDNVVNSKTTQRSALQFKMIPYISDMSESLHTISENEEVGFEDMLKNSLPSPYRIDSGGRLIPGVHPLFAERGIPLGDPPARKNRSACRAPG